MKRRVISKVGMLMLLLVGSLSIQGHARTEKSKHPKRPISSIHSSKPVAEYPSLSWDPRIQKNEFPLVTPNASEETRWDLIPGKIGFDHSQSPGAPSRFRNIFNSNYY